MILETIPSLNFYLFKVEDKKLFIPTVGDREWGGGGWWQLPIPSPPFYFDSNSISNKAARKEGAMMINKHGCPVDHPL